MFVGRIIDGLTGGNISTVFAYIADITKPEERGKYYGILGAAGGFGFMFGPAIGGFAATINLSAPFYFAAAVTIFNIIWGYFVLSESLHNEHKTLKLDFNHLNPFKQFHYVFSVTILRKIFLITFIFFLALNGMQGISSVFYKDVFNWNPSKIGIVLFIVGLVDIISQGFLVTKLIPILGDTLVSKLGLVFTCLGFIIIACTSVIISPALLYGGVIILIIGDGLFEPSINGIISKTVGPKIQGRVQGANQGMQSMARVVGPISAAWIYHYGKGLPYITFSILIILSLVLLILSTRDIKKHEAEYKFV